MVNEVDNMSNEIRRLKRINNALMGQVERSMDLQGSAFNMFRTSIVMENKVRERTIELQELNSELSQAKDAMSHFIAAASHDLLQPLNAARVFVSALSEQELNDKKRSLVNNISNAMDATEELLSALLDISRLDAGGISIEISDFRINTLLETLFSELSPVAEANGLSLKFVPCNAVVESDPKLVCRILRNFLTNAIRYTTSGKILLGCRRSNNKIRVGVWDTGIGIPDDKLDLIYKEFQRLHTKSLRVDNGVGLGLAIVDRISRQLGLTIVTRSRVGSGSYFAVEIPCGSAAQVIPSPSQTLHNTANVQLADSTILVIDNEPSILEAMQALLYSWSCEAIVAENKHNAMHLIEECETPPDAIIVDYHLDAGEIGVDAVREIRQRWGEEIPFVVITADHEREVASVVNKLGGHVLNKPIKPARLRALLFHLLRSG